MCITIEKLQSEPADTLEVSERISLERQLPSRTVRTALQRADILIVLYQKELVYDLGEAA